MIKLNQDLECFITQGIEHGEPQRVYAKLTEEGKEILGWEYTGKLSMEKRVHCCTQGNAIGYTGRVMIIGQPKFYLTFLAMDIDDIENVEETANKISAMLPDATIRRSSGGKGIHVIHRIKPVEFKKGERVNEIVVELQKEWRKTLEKNGIKVCKADFRCFILNGGKCEDIIKKENILDLSSKIADLKAKMFQENNKPATVDMKDFNLSADQKELLTILANVGVEVNTNPEKMDSKGRIFTNIYVKQVFDALKGTKFEFKTTSPMRDSKPKHINGYIMYTPSCLIIRAWADEKACLFLRGEKAQQRANGLFWEFDKEGKLHFSNTKMVDFANKQGGFYIYAQKTTLGVTENRIVHLENNIIELATSKDVQKFVGDSIRNQPLVIQDAFRNGVHRFLDETRLNFLPRITLDLLEDSQSSAYYPFRNGVVEVRKDAIELIPYSEIKKQIWNTSIIQRDFKPNLEEGDYERFVYNVCTPPNKTDFTEKERSSISKRHSSLKSGIGYLLHKYRNPSERQAVILSESSQTDDDERGRTGKGRILEGISKLRNVLTMDGRQFTFDRAFLWQRLDLDTDIIFIDDAKKSFNFRRLYSVMTEGIEVEKKNMKPFFIPASKSPKFSLSTNYQVEGSSESDKGRRFDIELECHYSSEYKPVDDFGRLFFEQWDDQEWQKFDSFMLGCTQYYLGNGLIPFTSETMRQKQLDCAVHEDYRVFFDSFFSENLKGGSPLASSYDITSSAMIAEFKQTMPSSDTDAKVNTNFGTALKKYCKAKRIDFQAVVKKGRGQVYFFKI